MKFSDLDFRTHSTLFGLHATHFFDNGYGVSVVCGPQSQGGKEGLYELAVLKGVADDWNICYDTPITEDVLGHLSEDEVEVLLYEVENLIY
jgi:hypothetical protein